MLISAVSATPGSSIRKRAGLKKEDVDKMMQSLSNWGRWGKNDQLGALNLITPTKRKQAALLATEGISVSLAYNAIKKKAFDSPPFQHQMVETGLLPESQSCGDLYSAQYHGFTITHLDALCHVFYGDKMYNGFPNRSNRWWCGEAFRD